jgi:hypothetical protein
MAVNLLLSILVILKRKKPNELFGSQHTTN